MFPEEERYTNKNLAWGGPSMQIANDIRALALAECLVNKGRFLDRIAASMDIKSRQTAWIIPYHDRSFGCFLGKYRKTDLSVGMDSQAIAVALDHLRGKIPADVVGRITAALWRNCFSNYLATAENPAELNRQGSNWWFFDEGAERGTVDEIHLSGYRKKLAKGSKCERALPVVLEGPITNTAVYVAFQNEFNRELMTLHSLPRGRHTVTVDGREIGTWDAQPLGEGINISGHPLAPQYAQSLKVRALVDRLWTLERRREKSERDQAEIKRLRVELKKAARPVSHSYKTTQAGDESGG